MKAKHRRKNTRGCHAAPEKRFQLSAVSCAVALALSGAASAQSQGPISDDAQDSLDEPIEEIIIVGIRRSLSDSISLKRNSREIVEAISSEDIGKLPDISIAESLARVPGLAGQRVNGRVQVISIRGLSPDFSTTLLNGRQQVSSGDNRAAEFDQYPSELVDGVLVYKTPKATLTSQGLSGTVDIRTVRPLSYDRRTVALNARLEQNSLDDLNTDGDEDGSRFSFSYIDQFANDTVGLAIGYARLDSPTLVEHYSGWFYDVQFGQFAPPNDNAIGLMGQEIFAVNREQIRDGAMAVVEWTPTDNAHLTLDSFYTQFEQTEIQRGPQWFSSVFTPDGFTISNPTFIDVGGTTFNDSGTENNVVPILRNDLNTRDDELFAIGLNGDFVINDRISLVADLGYSNVERKEQVLETYAGIAPVRTFDSIGFDIDLDGVPQYSPGFDYGDASQVQLGDIAPWGGWGHDGTIRFPDVEDDLTTADVHLIQDLTDSFVGDVVSQITYGINYADREKSKVVDDNNLFLKDGRANVSVDQQHLVAPASVNFAGFGSTFAFDLNSGLPVYYDMAPILNADKYNKDWTINEKILMAYVQADIDTTMFGVDVYGNFGIQIIRADQESTGFSFSNDVAGGTPTLTTTGAEYTDVLPTLNLVFDVAEDTKVRFGAGKTLARPRMDDLRSSISAGVSATTFLWGGSGGNPDLRPWEALALDLAVEHYFGERTYVALAGFHKDLDTYIYNQSVEFDFSDVPLQSTITPVSDIGLLTRPENGTGGELYGYELSGALDFGVFTDALDGFGLIGSYSDTKTNIDPEGPDSTVSLPGLSGEVYNVTAYFERGGFSSRISKRFRSAFRGEVVQLFATRGFTEILDDEQVDAQISYEFQDGALQGLTLLAQVNNLTNEPYRTRLGTTVANGAFLPERYDRYGRQLLVGMSYRFE